MPANGNPNSGGKNNKTIINNTTNTTTTSAAKYEGLLITLVVLFVVILLAFILRKLYKRWKKKKQEQSEVISKQQQLNEKLIVNNTYEEINNHHRIIVNDDNAKGGIARQQGEDARIPAAEVPMQFKPGVLQRPGEMDASIDLGKPNRDQAAIQAPEAPAYMQKAAAPGAGERGIGKQNGFQAGAKGANKAAGNNGKLGIVVGKAPSFSAAGANHPFNEGMRKQVPQDKAGNPFLKLIPVNTDDK